MMLVDRTPLVIQLDGAGCDLREVGGKGAGLDRLAAHGFVIPESYAITVSAYRQFIEESGLAPWLHELERAPIPEPSEIAEAAAEVDRRFLDPSLSEELRAAITQAAGRLLAAGRVAVRSSATAEDLGIASFAGQYRTSTGLETLDEVVSSVRRCWASLWLPSVRAYRRRQGISGHDLAMGVVIQDMVEADWSGVAFTRDPGGNPEAIRIEVVAGLGEALVSGRMTPDLFFVDRSSLHIHAPKRQTAPEYLETLGRMLLRVEQELDEPQDVEWAFVDGRLVLLQARPITVTGPLAQLDDGFDDPVGSSDEFTPRGVVEMLPGAVSPLLWTMSAPMLEHAFRSVIHALRVDPGSIDRPFVGRFRGRAALNLSALRDLASAMGGAASDVEVQFLGRAVDSGDEPEQASAGGLGAAIRAQRARRKLESEVELAVTAALGVVELDLDLSDLSARRLLAVRSAVRDLAWRLSAAEVGASGAGVGAYQGLERTLSRWLSGPDSALWAQRLTAGRLGDDIGGMAVAHSLRSAYETAAEAEPGLRAALRARPLSRCRERIEALGEPGARFLQQVDHIARRHGCQAIYGGTTWEEDPSAIWQQLALLASGNGTWGQVEAPPGIDELMDSLEDRRWRVLRVLTGQVIDLRRRFVDHQADEATRFLGLRERAKMALLALGGIERRIIQEGARRLESSGNLAAGQVELLADEEFEAALLGGAVPSEAVLFRRAMVGSRCAQMSGLPETFVGRPDEEVVVGDTGSDRLVGWSGSPGVVRGTARVITDLAQADRVQPGDIVVAPATDPSWTPLFVIVGGLVLEEGGPLSHGAIVAREFGIPAVLNVPGATRHIAEGDEVEVDGFSGTVRVLVREEVGV